MANTSPMRMGQSILHCFGPITRHSVAPRSTVCSGTARAVRYGPVILAGIYRAACAAPLPLITALPDGAQFVPARREPSGMAQ